MANFKRKRAKKYWLSTCGSKHCIYDANHDRTHNGRERYLPSHWKKFGGNRPWRYVHKNVDNWPFV